MRNEENLFFTQVFDPIVSSASRVGTPLYQLKLVQEVLKHWKCQAELSQVLDDFKLKNLSPEYLEKVVEEQFLQAHPVSQAEVVSVLEILIEDDAQLTHVVTKVLVGALKRL